MSLFSNNVKKRLNVWFADLPFQRLLKNSSILLSGNILSSLFSLAGFALMARALGPAEFGILVIIQTYVRLIDRLINFQSWQTLIKYGAEILKRQDRPLFKSLIKFGFFLDLSTAVIGTVVAVVLSSFLIRWQQLDGQYLKYVWIYSSLILFNLTGTPTAILRLFDRFKLFACQEIIIAIIRFFLIVIVFFIYKKFSAFLVICLIADILAYVLILLFGVRTLYLQKVRGIFSANIGDITKNYTNLWGFLISTNVSSSIRVLSRECDVIIIGAYLGETAVGLFKVVKQFASIITRLIDPLFYAIYPELSRICADRNTVSFRKLILKSSFGAGGLALGWGLVLNLFGRQIIHFVVGPQFSPIYPTVQFYMIATILAALVFPFFPAFLAIEKHKSFTLILALSTGIYLTCLPYLLKEFFIDGAAIAYVIFYLFYFVLSFIQLRKYKVI